MGKLSGSVVPADVSSGKSQRPNLHRDSAKVFLHAMPRAPKSHEPSLGVCSGKICCDAVFVVLGCGVAAVDSNAAKVPCCAGAAVGTPYAFHVKSKG